MIGQSLQSADLDGYPAKLEVRFANLHLTALLVVAFCLFPGLITLVLQFGVEVVVFVAMWNQELGFRCILGV